MAEQATLLPRAGRAALDCVAEEEKSRLASLGPMTRSSPPSLPTDPPLRPGQRLAFGVGGFLDNFGANGVKNVAQPMYNLILGVNPAAIGIVIALTRVWDALIAPPMGNATDNARTRWGRRRPYIFLGALGCAAVFPLLWWLPVSPQGAPAFAWLLGVSLLFYTAYTVYTIPYHALGFELSPDYHEKTRLMGLRTIFTSVSGFAVQWFYPLTQQDWFSSPRQGLFLIGIVLAVLIGLTGIIPAVCCRDRAERAHAPPHRIPLREALQATLHSRPFLRLLGCTGLLIFGTNLVNSLGLYVNIYYVHHGDPKAAALIAGWSGTVYHATVIASMPLLVRLSRAMGKKNALVACLALVFLSSVAKWFLYDPVHPWRQLIVLALMAPGGAGLWMLTESMVADVCEVDEAESGRRLEGMYSAVYSWVIKVGLALCMVLSGFILVWVGFDVARGPFQSPRALYLMRLLFSGLPAVAALLGIFLIARFPLTPRRMAEVRALLLQRRSNTS